MPALSLITAIGLDALVRVEYRTAPLFAFHNARAVHRRVIGDRETRYGY